MASTRVAFIAGVGRSGTTLLERMLGSDPRACAVGELIHLLERGVLGNERCGCGAPFATCPFWAAVGDRAFGGWANVDARRLKAEQDAAVRNRRLLHLLFGPSGERARGAGLLRDFVAPLVHAVRAEAGAEVVVDSSKHPSWGGFLSRAGDLDVRVVHVVRRSEGVAHSWAKVVRRPETDDDVMAQASPVKIATRWLVWNAAIDGLGSRIGPVLRVRYEDLVADPVTVLGTVGEFLGIPMPPERLPFIDGREAYLERIHSVAGNPMRFDPRVHLELDEAWRAGLPSRRRAIVHGLTFPLLRRYGYVDTARQAAQPKAGVP